MSFSNGINASKDKYGSGRSMISVMDILSEGTIKYSSIINSVDVSNVIEAKNKVERGDLVFVRSSEVIEEVGWSKAYLETEYCLHSGFTIRGKKEKEFSSLFVENSLNKKNRKQIERKAGGSTRYNVSQKILKTLTINLPSVEEQQQVANFIKNIDKIIALHQRKLENIKELKLSYLQRLIPKKGNNESLSKFTQFPNSWTKVKLKECFKERKERSGEGELLAVTINSGVLKADSLDRKDNSSKDKSNYKVVKIGDIAYNSMRMWQGASGLSEFEGIVSPAYTVLIPNESKVDALFISYLFKTENMIQKFQANSQGLTSDTWNLKFPMLKNISIILPPLNEQKHIGKFLEQVDKNISIYENKINKLLDIKKSYLSKMFV